MSFYWIQCNWSTLGITHVKQEINTTQGDGISSSRPLVSCFVLSVTYYLFLTFTVFGIFVLQIPPKGPFSVPLNPFKLQ